MGLASSCSCRSKKKFMKQTATSKVATQPSIVEFAEETQNDRNVSTVSSDNVLTVTNPIPARLMKTKAELVVETLPPQRSKKEKKDSTQCISCAAVLNNDHPGIKCLQSHSICSECGPRFVDMVLSCPEENFPPNCPLCKVGLVLQTFEMQLNSEQSTLFTTYMFWQVIVKQEKSEGRVFVSCPICKYLQIHQKSLNFIVCCNKNCEKRSCYYCRLECPLPETSDSDEYQDSAAQAHLDCANIHELRISIEQAIEEGSKVKCPKCGTGGQKDLASCTHMACPKCNQVFCYVCGLAFEDCDKEPGSENIFGHNVDWPTNLSRCPMYLTELAEVDEQWPESDEQCLELFHSIRIKQNIRKVIETKGLSDILKLEEKFRCIQNNGFSIQSVLNDDLTLIARRDEEDAGNLPA